MSIIKAKRTIKELEKALSLNCSRVYLKKLFKDLILNQNYTIICDTLSTGNNILRGVIYKEKYYDSKYFSYNPNPNSTGRVHKKGQPMFYGSWSINPIPYEIKAEKGDKLYLSNWKNKSPILYQIVGLYEQNISSIPHSKEKRTEHQRLVDQYLRSIFSNEGKSEKEEEIIYRCTTIISELLLGPVYFEGMQFTNFQALLYPSVQASGYEPVIAIKPDVIDNCFECVQVNEYIIENIQDTGFSIQKTDISKNVENGIVEWNEDPQNWTLHDKERIKLIWNGYTWDAFHENGEKRKSNIRAELFSR